MLETTVKAKHLYAQRKKFYDYLSKSDNCIDKELLDILKKLNTIKGVATRYSCASHPDKLTDRFYINFICSKTGLNNLFKLFLQLQTICEMEFVHHVSMMAPHKLKLSFQVLYDDEWFEKPVPTWNIDATFNSKYAENDKKLFLESFKQVLEKLK